MLALVLADLHSGDTTLSKIKSDYYERTVDSQAGRKWHSGPVFGRGQVGSPWGPQRGPAPSQGVAIRVSTFNN